MRLGDMVRRWSVGEDTREVMSTVIWVLLLVVGAVAWFVPATIIELRAERDLAKEQLKDALEKLAAISGRPYR